MILANAASIERALSLLDAELEARGAASVELVVVGGAAMSVLGFIARPTKDVDVLGVRDVVGFEREPRIVKHSLLPDPIPAAASAVAKALAIDPGWLNSGPADLLDHGLPHGFETRLVKRQYGSRLAVCFASREDLIALKVYAAADSGVGRHTDDLAALEATCAELIAGAKWACTHDRSPAFRGMLLALLDYFGCDTDGEALADEC